MNASGSSAEKQPWIRPRHQFFRSLLGPVLGLCSRLRYHVRIERFRDEGAEPVLILYNHQTPFDQFFIMSAFRHPVYYVATEDIFSKGMLSSALRFIAAPIPIRKQKTDLQALATISRVAREGGNIALAPEGNRTFSGKTEYMSPAVVHLIRRLRLPVLFFRIEGGYGVHPRWSDKVRRGSMHARPVRLISPEEYGKMSARELLDCIQEGLSVNEAVPGGRYVSRRKAEYLERMVYVCPFCGLSVFRSSGDETECLSCRRRVRYGEDKRLTGVGFDFPFSFANDWYEYQKRFVNRLDPGDWRDKPMFTDRVCLYEVFEFRRKELREKDISLRLYGDRIVFGEEGENPRICPYSEISGMAAIGRNRLNFYHGDQTFQVRGDCHFNALKYVNLDYRAINVIKGEPYGEFLGL